MLEACIETHAPKEAITALREELQKKGQGASTKNEETLPCKKPAMSSKAKTHGMARPAASVKTKFKRPAAAPARVSVGGMCQAAASKPDRDALLKKIPKAVLQRYKDGCSRCYHRAFCTVSCWARRGYK